MKHLLPCAAVLLGCALLASAPVYAVNRAIDNAPGATLLLPYFEADLNNANGSQTAFRLDNTSATAILANVTLWTDLGIPTQNFNLYLVGYDSVTMDLRLLFKNGIVPVTASAGQDPTDTISPQGPISQDINFASCTGTLPPTPLPAATVAGLRAAHSGQSSTLFANQCAASPRADGIARGYITIDTINSCTTANPTTPGYTNNNPITQQSVLTGSYSILNRSTKVEAGGPLVPVETPFGGNGGTSPPFTAGQRTFYGSYNALSATDQREPLGSVWSARFVNGGALGSNTQVTVWRDPGTTVSPFACGGALPAPFPLTLGGPNAFAAFDEQEEVVIGSTTNQFPLATQRVPTSTFSGNVAGMLYMNLNLAAGPGPTQSWVQVDQVVAGRFGGTTWGTVVDSTSSLQGCTAPCGIFFNN